MRRAEKNLSNRTIAAIIAGCYPLSENTFCTDLYIDGREILIPCSFIWKGKQVEWDLLPKDGTLPPCKSQPVQLTWNQQQIVRTCDSFEARRNLIRLAFTYWYEQIRVTPSSHPAVNAPARC